MKRRHGVQNTYKPVWSHMMENLYTSDKDEVLREHFVSDARNCFPGLRKDQARAVWYRMLKVLLRIGAIETKFVASSLNPSKFKRGSITVIKDRAAIKKHLEIIHSTKVRTSRAKKKIDIFRVPEVPAAATRNVPDMTTGGVYSITANGLVTRSERVIAALYKRCLEYKKEVAELLDELAACRASVQDATRKVVTTNEAIRRSERMASEIDLKEVGIDPEGV